MHLSTMAVMGEGVIVETVKGFGDQIEGGKKTKTRCLEENTTETGKTWGKTDEGERRLSRGFIDHSPGDPWPWRSISIQSGSSCQRSKEIGPI